MKKALLVVMVLLLLGAGALFGGGRAEEETDVVELTIWFGREEFIPADRFAAFHAEYPNIRVTADVVPLEEVVAEFSRSADARRAPDVAQVGHNAVGPLVGRGLLRDMSDMFARWEQEDPELYNDTADWAWTLTAWDGVPYGFGLHAGTNGSWMVYRKDVLADLGYDGPPQTWNELLEIARAVRDSDYDMIPFSLIGSRVAEPIWVVGPFMAMGGQFVNNVPQVDSPAGRHLIEFHQILARENLTHPDVLAWSSGEMRAAFMAGDAAMAPIGWNIYPTIQQNLQYGVEWDHAPQPARAGAENQARRMLIGWPYYVSRDTQHPYEVSLLLRYLARPDIVSEVAKRYQPASTLSVGQTAEYAQAKPWAPDKIEWMPQLVPLPVHPRSTAVEEIWKDLLQESLTNTGADPAAMARRYQQEFNAVTQ